MRLVSRKPDSHKKSDKKLKSVSEDVKSPSKEKESTRAGSPKESRGLRFSFTSGSDTESTVESGKTEDTVESKEMSIPGIVSELDGSSSEEALSTRSDASESDLTDDEDDTSLSSEPEGFEDFTPEDESSEEGSKNHPKKISAKKRKKAVIVEEEPEDDYSPDEEEDDPDEIMRKEKVGFKDLILSLVETAVACAIFAIIGFQFGGVLLNHIISGIIGG